MFTIIGAMAELESALISERTTAAMEYVRNHGTRTGKSIGGRKLCFDGMRRRSYGDREKAAVKLLHTSEYRWVRFTMIFGNSKQNIY